MHHRSPCRVMRAARPARTLLAFNTFSQRRRARWKRYTFLVPWCLAEHQNMPGPGHSLDDRIAEEFFPVGEAMVRLSMNG